jgi:predicted ATPase
VAAALPGDVEAVETACEDLVAQGALLVDAGVAEWPDGTISGRYRFRHALYREVLYDGIAEARRARQHAEIGRRLEAGFAARAAEHAAELAMHFARGRVHERAAHFHALAVTAALERHAAHEALGHCTAALDALARLPADAERTRRELELAVTRATLLMATQGYAAAETERAFARARTLCDAQPAGEARFAVLRGLLSFHQVRAELDASGAIGEELLRLADTHPDDAALRVQAHYGVGTTLFHVGALVPARGHLEAALRAYDPATHRHHSAVYGGYDPGVACGLWLAWTLILQGELAAGLERTHAALALAQRQGIAFTLAWAHHAVGISHQLLGDLVASAAALAEAERLAEEHGFLYVLGMAKVNRGWALLQQGDLASGASLLREGVALVDGTGAGLVRPTYLAMLAGVALREGDRDAAMAGLDAAVAEMERTNERLSEASLLLQKANVLAALRPDDPTVDPLLQRALEVARAQEARLVELRVTAAIARRLATAGRTDEARDLLAARWAWFEGRTPIIPETAAARRLLAQLGG